MESNKQKPGMQMMKQPALSFEDKAVCSVHEFYLCGEIGDAEDYTEWFNKIRHTGQNDMIKIYINSPGGNLFTAIQFMSVMRDCKANIMAVAEGMCGSAATIIFLMANQYEIAPNSMFLFHNYSAMVGGKGGEMFDQIKHERAWNEKLLNDVYTDFLTEKEIKAILENKDIWMSGLDVSERLAKRNKQIEKKNASNKKKA